MSQSTPNPTAPILLVLVTLLFAVTWSHDQAHAATCPQHVVAAVVVPVDVIQPVSVVESHADDLVVVAAVQVEPETPMAPRELPAQQPRLPEWVMALQTEESPAPTTAVREDWLTSLLDRAEASIVR